jgi:hypothetical protein
MASSLIPVGIGLASGVFGKKRPDISAAIAQLRAARPTGYLTPADYRAAELTKGRLSETAGEAGRYGGYEVSRRARARGLAGSPSEERDLARVNQQVLLGKQHAGETAEEQLYTTQRGREAWQQGNENAIFSANVGQTRADAARHDAQQAAFWNSLYEFLPTIMGGLSQVGSAPSGGIGGFDTPGGGAGGFDPSLLLLG